MIIDGKSYSWTQPACDTCFAETFPSVTNPARMVKEMRTDERCCMCGAVDRSGIFIRINPSTVPYPTEEAS
jgi:hypothetical protein